MYDNNIIIIIEVGRTDSIKTRLEVFLYIFLYPAKLLHNY